MRTGIIAIALLVLSFTAVSAWTAETESADQAAMPVSSAQIVASDGATASSPGQGDGAIVDFSQNVRLSGAVHSALAKNSSARANMNSDQGVHLSMDGERPSLAYRFSESGVARLRGNIRGARIVFSWSY